MFDDFLPAECAGFPPQEQRPDALSVAAAMALAKSALESVTLKIIGEVSEFNNKAGYKAVYFTIKDSKASLPCMMWTNRFKAAGVDVHVGSLVEITGRFTLYAAKGRMNFDVFSLSLAGEGDLRAKVANLAKKLEAQGLMDPAIKKPLPAYPQVIGLVTSPRGAAVHDVLRTLRRRYPLARVVLAGVPVEGAAAPQGLIAGLACVQDAGAEVVLLVRGGGSFEDLMPFNDEGLARAIRGMSVPVVTGIGHEPDTCIADLVADYRASTPTGAAEACSPDSQQLSRMLTDRGMAVGLKLQRRLERSGAWLDKTASRPVLSDPHQLFAADMMHVDSLLGRLDFLGQNMLAPYGMNVALRAARLHDISPLTVLARGYAVARDERGRVLRDATAVSSGDRINVSLGVGSLACDVVEVLAGNEQ